MDHIVVDVEIAHTIEETPGGWDATDKLGVAVACVWQYQDQRMRVYGPDDVPALRERILKADRISSYNGLNFDYPVIWGISKQDWLRRMPDDESGKVFKVNAIRSELLPKTDDMLRRIWRAQGFDPDVYNPRLGGTKLDQIAKATLSSSKIGTGADAPKWYKAGQVQKVVNYCCDDVALERDLTDFVERYGYVIQDGRRLEIPAWKGGS